MPRFLQILVIVGGLILLVGSCPAARITYDVTAETDALRYHPDTDNLQKFTWLLDSVEYRANHTEEEPEVQVISGTLQFSPGAIVTIWRRSSGPLYVQLDRPRYDSVNAVGTLIISDSVEIELNSGALFTLHLIEARAGRGEPVVLPVAGTLIIGSGAIHGSTRSAGVRSGDVELLSKEFRDTSVVVIRSIPLRPGDTFRIQESDGPGYGVLAADERPVINVAYRVLGSEARIERLHGSTRSITASISDVLKSDPLLRSIAGIVLVFLTLSWGIREWLRTSFRRKEGGT